MNTLEGIIEDVNKSDLVSDKVIKKVRELIGQEKWQELYDEESDIITTTGEILITLKGIPDLEAQIEKMKCGGNCKHLYHVNTGGCYDAKCDLTGCDCINCKDEWEFKG